MPKLLRADPMTPSAAASGWVLEAFAGISDALVVIDAQARVVYRNAAAERLAGARDPKAHPQDWSAAFGIYHPDTTTPYPTAELPLSRALRGQEVREAGLFIRNALLPDGIHLLVNANPLFDAAGEIRGAACIFRDVTTTLKNESKLHENDRQKRAILDNIPEIAWLKDANGRYLLVNQRFAEAAGRATPEAVVGLTDFDFWPLELAERYRRDDADIMRSGLTKRVEEPFVGADGQRSWLETFKTRIVDDAGNVIGTTGIARDVTERRQADADMRSQHDELERRVLERTTELAEAQENLVRQERLAVLGQLAGGVAHQIRNPLAAIMNASYVLKRHVGPHEHPNVGDAIRIIHDEVRHANIIITGLLDYARMRTPDRHPASVVELLERILGSDWIPADVRVSKRLPENDPVVREIDADQLQGAISNLVRNAVDAMPNGGELDVALEVHEKELEITVSDNGLGISPQLRAHLFEPLHSTKPMGIGLGLVTARRFVEAHGGHIAAVDVPRGARFEIRLPV